MPETDSQVKQMRLLQWVLIAAIPILAFVPEAVAFPVDRRWTRLHWLMVGIAGWCIFEGFRFRRRWVFQSEKVLANDPNNSKALTRWKAGQVMCLVTAEAVALWGLNVRMVLHSTFWQAALFYVIGLFLLLLWTPRRAF